MSNFLLQKTDVVPIKKTSSGGPVNVSVGNILGYGRSQGYGNSFVLYDCGNSREGLAIRYFNVSTDTIYLATTTFLGGSEYYIGIGIYDNRYIQSISNVLHGSTGSAISALSVATNFLSQTVSGIQYGKNGGNISGYGDQQAFYIDESVTTIYIDNELVPIPEPGPSKWRQIFFGNSVLLSEGTIIDEAVCENGWMIRKQDQVELDFINLYLTGEMINSNQIPEEETEVYRKGQYYITVCQSSPGQWSPDHGYSFKFKKDGEDLQLVYSTGGNGRYQGGYKFAVAINETEQRGAFVVGDISYSNYAAAVGRSLSGINPNQSESKLYNWLKAAEPGATIKVNYYLPDYDYTYAKITYKQDSEPASETDGESVEILKDETSVNIEGLEEEKTYYFKIFTDKSESEVFQYTVEVDPVPPEYKTYIDNINGTGFDWIRELEQDTATITNSDRSTFTADMYKYYPMNKVTWYTYSHQGTDVEYWNKTTFEGQTTALFVSSKIDKVEINSNNNVYSCTITKNNDSVTSPDRMFVYEKNVTMGGVYTKDTLPRGWYANFNYHSGYLAYGPNCNPFYLAGSWATRTFSGTLTEVFEQLQRYVRNIDIYVDGVLWSKAGK